jgi:hypothetical protein
MTTNLQSQQNIAIDNKNLDIQPAAKTNWADEPVPDDQLASDLKDKATLQKSSEEDGVYTYIMNLMLHEFFIFLCGILATFSRHSFTVIFILSESFFLFFDLFQELLPLKNLGLRPGQEKQELQIEQTDPNSPLYSAQTWEELKLYFIFLFFHIPFHSLYHYAFSSGSLNSFFLLPPFCK